ncbi:hypothetical protein RFI_34600, partial [Reticulomyxa filosa]
MYLINQYLDMSSLSSVSYCCKYLYYHCKHPCSICHVEFPTYPWSQEVGEKWSVNWDKITHIMVQWHSELEDYGMYYQEKKEEQWADEIQKCVNVTHLICRVKQSRFIVLRPYILIPKIIQNNRFCQLREIFLWQLCFDPTWVPSVFGRLVCLQVLQIDEISVPDRWSSNDIYFDYGTAMEGKHEEHFDSTELRQNLEDVQSLEVLKIGAFSNYNRRDTVLLESLAVFIYTLICNQCNKPMSIVPIPIICRVSRILFQNIGLTKIKTFQVDFTGRFFSMHHLPIGPDLEKYYCGNLVLDLALANEEMNFEHFIPK